MPEQTAALIIGAVREWGGRVIAVGTTVVRALETVARPDGLLPRAPGGPHSWSRRDADCGWSTG